MKGLVETNNISYNPEHPNESNLPASSPIQPREDSENSHFEALENSRRGHYISERFGDNNDSYNDRKSESDPRLDLSPSEQPSRKRRKVSSCDTPSLPLHSSLSRHPSESQVSCQ